MKTSACTVERTRCKKRKKNENPTIHRHEGSLAAAFLFYFLYQVQRVSLAAQSSLPDNNNNPVSRRDLPLTGVHTI